jgi:long-chain fatty acid transport protein
MSRVFKLVLVLGVSFVLTVGLYGNGMNLNGVGSKAIAMGGAFVGLADDYSAVFWNPAGLTQMKDPNLALYGTFIFPKGSYKFNLLGIDAKTENKVYPSGALGYFKPLSEKVVVGILGYVPSAIGAKWNGEDLKLLAGGVNYMWESKLGMFTLSPVVAFKLSDTFSLGATVNLSYGLLQLKRPALGQYEEDLNGMAFGATIGALFKPSDKFSIGLTFKTPMKVKIKGDASMSGAGLLGLPGTSELEREADWPMWIGAGIAFKPIEPLTITADVQYTNWKKMDMIAADFSDPGWALVFGQATDLVLRWDDATQIRFGAQFQASEALAIRAGFYIDPGPGPEATQNILLPGFDYNVVTFGLGYNTGKVNIDLCFEYVIGKERDVGLLEADPAAGMPGIHKFDIFVPNIAITFFL